MSIARCTRILHAASRSCSLLLCLSALQATPAQAEWTQSIPWQSDGQYHAMRSWGNEVILGGEFAAVGKGRDASGYRRFDPSTGLPLALPPVRGVIQVTSVDGQGGFYVGGSFTEIGGRMRRNLAHVLADGTIEPWFPDLDGVVSQISVTPTRICVVGTFTHADGVLSEYLAILDRATARVVQPTVGLSFYLNRIGAQIVAVGDTLLVCGGDLEYVRGAPQGSPFVPRQAFAAIDLRTNTLLDLGTNLPVGSQGRPSWMPYADRDLVILNGDFDRSASGFPTKSSLVIDLHTGARLPWPLPNAIIQTAARRGNILYVADGSTLRMIDLTTGALHGTPLTASYTLLDFATIGDLLYMVGGFTTIGGQPRANLAVFDMASESLSPQTFSGASGTRIEASAGQLLIAGAPDGPLVAPVPRARLVSFLRDHDTPTAWAPQIDGDVTWMERSGDSLVIAGVFQHVDGAARSSLAMFDLTTKQLTAFNPPLGLPSAPQGIQTGVVRNRVLYLGGGGVLPPTYEFYGLVRAIDLRTGLPLAGFVPPQPDAAVLRMVFDNEGRLFLAGQFKKINGLPRAGYAQIDPLTGALLSWSPSVELFSWDMQPEGDGMLLAGLFKTVNGVSRTAIARVNRTTGAVDPAWNANLGGSYAITDFVPGPSGLLMFGNFRPPGATVSQSLAGLDPATASVRSVGFDMPRGCWDAAPEGLLMATEGGGVVRIRAQDVLPPTVSALGPDLPVVRTQDVATLRWLVQDESAVARVRVSLSRTGPSGPWTMLEDFAGDPGSMAWPVTGPLSEDAWLQVEGYDVQGNLTSAISSTPFAIRDSNSGVGGGAPTRFALGHAEPNPAVQDARIAFEVPTATRLRLTLHDIQGREVIRWFDGVHAAGRDAVILRRGGLPAGLYFVRMQADGVDLRRSVVLFR